jgi:hypothetical protein
MRSFFQFALLRVMMNIHSGKNKLARACNSFSSFTVLTDHHICHGAAPMHRILAAAAALGLLALPMQAAAQTSSEPTAKTAPAGQTDSAAKAGASAQKARNAKTDGKSDAKSAEGPKVNKAKGKREARLAKTKRMARPGHKARYAKGQHGTRFVKSHRGRHAFGYSTPRRLHGHHRHHHRVAYGRGCR